MSVRRAEKKLIGEILREKGLITQHQLEEALRAQEESLKLRCQILLTSAISHASRSGRSQISEGLAAHAGCSPPQRQVVQQGQ